MIHLYPIWLWALGTAAFGLGWLLCAIMTVGREAGRMSNDTGAAVEEALRCKLLAEAEQRSVEQRLRSMEPFTETKR